MTKPNTAKSAELQILIWFLQEGWEVFTPVADLYGTDLVVRHPETKVLLAIQIKHKQPGSLNEGRLENDWVEKAPPFDYLVFFVPERMRGLIIPSGKLQKTGRAFIFYARDSDGYSRGHVRPLFQDFAFDLGPVPPGDRGKAFVTAFAKVHTSTNVPAQ